jgi:hypothetical protein
MSSSATSNSSSSQGSLDNGASDKQQAQKRAGGSSSDSEDESDDEDNSMGLDPAALLAAGGCNIFGCQSSPFEHMSLASITRVALPGTQQQPTQVLHSSQQC